MRMKARITFLLLMIGTIACTPPTITEEELNRQLQLARANCNTEIEALKAQISQLRGVTAEKAAIETRYITIEKERTDLTQRVSTLQAEVDELKRLREEAQKLAVEAAEVKERAQAAEKERDEIRSELQKFIDIGGVGVDVTPDGVMITMRDAILFDSGKSDLKTGATEILTKISQILAKNKARDIRVAGHTDNAPIKTAEFPSNWELSAARAISVLNKLSDVSRIPKQKFVAMGFGEYRPVADNASPDGKARNRRVEIYLVPEK
ncbi:MAG: OmpA family protein [Candidatus Hydrogenedentota bacterium]